MVILTNEPLSFDFSIGELSKHDSKANMLETFQLIGVGVAKSWDKTSLATVMDDVFEHSPALFANILPKEERNLLAGLLECRQDEYVICPADKGKYLMLQRLHLVVTHEDNGTWHLYMPDKIRHRLDNMFKEDLKLYPEIEKMHNLLNLITERRDRFYHLLDTNNPDTLTKQKAQELSDEIGSIASFLAEAKQQLKEIEKYLRKNTDTSLDVIWGDINITEMMIAATRTAIHMKLLEQPLPEKEHKPAKVVPISKPEGMSELTLKVQLDDTPIYRTFKVIDRCSFFELNMLIQFCYNWNEMNPYSFMFRRNGNNVSPMPTTRLSAFGLKEGDTFQFHYDILGDKWVHTLTVQKSEPYKGNEEDYEPRCIAGNGPDPGEHAGGNAWVRRNLPYVQKNKKKYYPFSKAEINDSFHFWWTTERHWWIESGRIKYDD